MAEHRPQTNDPQPQTQNTPNTQHSRKHPHYGHPAAAPLLGEGSGEPAGPKGQPMLSLKGAEKRIRCRPLGGGEAGKRPNPPQRQQNQKHQQRGGWPALASPQRAIVEERTILASHNFSGKNMQQFAV